MKAKILSFIAAAAVAASSCSNCGAGYYCTGGSARAACAIGKYQNSATGASCLSCATGFTTNSTASQASSACVCNRAGGYGKDKNGNCKAQLPNQILTAQVNKIKKPNGFARLVFFSCYGYTSNHKYYW